MNFVDNHDVNRIASTLTCKEHLKLIYAMLFGIPGIPCVYYGSEFGAQGRKEDEGHDLALRAAFDKPQWNELTDYIAALAKAKRESEALNYGSYRTDRSFLKERASMNECLWRSTRTQPIIPRILTRGAGRRLISLPESRMILAADRFCRRILQATGKWSGDAARQQRSCSGHGWQGRPGRAQTEGQLDRMEYAGRHRNRTPAILP